MQQDSTHTSQDMQQLAGKLRMVVHTYTMQTSIKGHGHDWTVCQKAWLLDGGSLLALKLKHVYRCSLTEAPKNMSAACSARHSCCSNIPDWSRVIVSCCSACVFRQLIACCSSLASVVRISTTSCAHDQQLSTCLEVHT